MKYATFILLGAFMQPMPVQAQSVFGDLLRNAMQRKSPRTSDNAQTARQEQLSKVNAYIQRLPDEACKLPEDHVKKWISENLDDGDLMASVQRTVFFDTAKPAKPSGYEALLEKTRQETEQRYAASQAFYSGRQVPVGQPAAAPRPQYRIDVLEMKATGRIENGLNCSANVRAGALRFPITYTVRLDPGDPDGWNGSLDTPPFTEAFALEHPDRIKINFQISYLDTKDLSLAEAREAAAASRAASREREREADAATPRHSPAAIQACRALEASVKKIIEGNSNGAVNVIEVSTLEESAGARRDGTLSCSGAVYTNRGKVLGSYGTSRSPKGQLLIEWQPQ